MFADQVDCSRLADGVTTTDCPNGAE